MEYRSSRQLKLEHNLSPYYVILLCGVTLIKGNIKLMCLSVINNPNIIKYISQQIRAMETITMFLNTCPFS